MAAAPDWPVYSLKLKNRAEVAERTMEIKFDKPAAMTFKAGQFMDLTLIDPPENHDRDGGRADGSGHAGDVE